MDRSSVYLDPDVAYVLRNPNSSRLVEGVADVSGNKPKDQDQATLQSLAWTYGDDIVFFGLMALFHGHIKNAKAAHDAAMKEGKSPHSAASMKYKIVSSIPSWGKTVTGVFTGSDFQAGNSYLPQAGSPGWGGAFATISASRIRGIVSTATLAGALLWSGLSQATQPPSVDQLKADIASVEASYDRTAAGRVNASNMLYETAVHESGRLKFNRQMVKEHGHLVPRGVARSVFMIETKTAKNLVAWAKNKPRARNLLTTESGFTYKKLAMMSQSELGDYLVKNNKFAAAIARLKYASSHGKIPGTLESRAHYWSKYYQGTNDYSKEKQYISDNRKMAEELKAASLSKVVRKHIRPLKTNAGLVQKMHDTKIGHAISSLSKKLSMRGV